MTCKSRRRNTEPNTSPPIASSCQRGLLIRLCCGLPTISLNNNSRAVSVGMIEVDLSSCKLELMCRRLQVPAWHIHDKPCCYSSLTVMKNTRSSRSTCPTIGVLVHVSAWRGGSDGGLSGILCFPLGGCVRRDFACEPRFGEGKIQAAATRHV